MANVPCAISNALSTQIVVVAQYGTPGTSGDVVITMDTGAVVTRTLGWTYVAVGNIASVSPPTGQFGTLVTIFGTNLLEGGNQIVSAWLNGVAAEKVISSNNTVIVVQAGCSISTGSGIISLEVDTGPFINGSSWSYVTASQILSVTPESGQFGTIVSIQGSLLYGGGTRIASVSLGGVSASIKSQNSTLIVVVAQSGAASNGGNIIVVSDTGATAIDEGVWTYVPAGVIRSCEAMK